MAPCNLDGDGGHDFAHVARIPFQTITEDAGRIACSFGHLGRCFEGHLRCSGHAGLHSCQAGIVCFKDSHRPLLNTSLTGSGKQIPNRRRMASASTQLEVSPTVGPDAMSQGWSPGTSEISSVTTLGGWQAAAKRPPLMAERCRRTQFISLMLAPDLSTPDLPTA